MYLIPIICLCVCIQAHIQYGYARALLPLRRFSLAAAAAKRHGLSVSQVVHGAGHGLAVYVAPETFAALNVGAWRLSRWPGLQHVLSSKIANVKSASSLEDLFKAVKSLTIMMKASLLLFRELPVVYVMSFNEIHRYALCSIKLLQTIRQQYELFRYLVMLEASPRLSVRHVASLHALASFQDAVVEYAKTLGIPMNAKLINTMFKVRLMSWRYWCGVHWQAYYSGLRMVVLGWCLCALKQALIPYVLRELCTLSFGSVGATVEQGLSDCISVELR